MKFKPPSPEAAPWQPEATPTFWINHTSRVVMKHFEQRLRPLDFGMAYMPVAIALEENSPLPQKQLAELAQVEQPTMAALLMRMERDGLIVRKANSADRRSTLFALTDKARDRLPAAKQQLAAVVAQAMNGIPDADQARLMALLATVVGNLEKE
ncbi:MarR family winged helix-turn-helix transcriptional regulator [Pleomorphomonas oryzae]|uniref:MarR family winged helix-turn-helix transcriptional regulator n=1 Tax=Pleomorphomonas oryzae TaxID=261934 RepID=UPI00041FCE2D|nr:MarR family transcriptional regulator [Pleomorphomonas oryzae]